jgi:hypothetical protein
MTTPPKKVYAKPVVTEYNSRNVKVDTSIKIATSNLFIETASVPVDYMIGATFDGIGGNEFINHGESSVILEYQNSLVGDASDVLQRNNSIQNQKGAIGYDLTSANFAIDLDKTNITSFENTQDKDTFVDINKEHLVGFWWADNLPDPDSFTYINNFSINVYSDYLFKNIYIELQNIDGSEEEIEVEFIKNEPVRGII